MLYHSPANLFVAGFIGSPAMNQLHVSATGPLLVGGADVGIADDLGGERATVGFRPEAVVVGAGPIAARIRVVEDLGSEVFVHLVIQHEGEEQRLVAKAAAPFAGAADDNVQIGLRGTVHLFDTSDARRTTVSCVTAVLVTGAAGDIGARDRGAAGVGGVATSILADHPDVAAQLEESAEQCRGLGGERRHGDVRRDGRGAPSTPPIAGVGADRRTRQQRRAARARSRRSRRYPLDDARRVFDVNVLGLIAVLAAVSRRMIESGSGGSIVNVASMAGVSGAPNMPAYSASKAAVIGLTKAAAKDLAPARHPRQRRLAGVHRPRSHVGHAGRAAGRRRQPVLRDGA